MKNLFLLFTAFPLLFLLVGCVNRQLAESYGQFLDTAGIEYINYVNADPLLDDTDKEIRLMNYNQACKTADKFKTTKWSW